MLGNGIRLTAAGSSANAEGRPMGNITKKDLVEEISTRTGLTQVDTKIVLESFIEIGRASCRERV